MVFRNPLLSNSSGASFFFLFLFLHLGRAISYGNGLAATLDSPLIYILFPVWLLPSRLNRLTPRGFVIYGKMNAGRNLPVKEFCYLRTNDTPVNKRTDSISIPVLIRIELYSSGNRIISPENQNFYNISITLHGFLMIFFLVMPGLFGGIGN